MSEPSIAPVPPVPIGPPAAKETVAAPSQSTLAKVSMCNRPAAAAAGTDVLEAPEGSPQAADGVSPATCSPVGSGTAVSCLATPMASGSAGGRGESSDVASHRRCKDPAVPVSPPPGDEYQPPAKVSTVCYHNAMETMEWAIKLLLQPQGPLIAGSSAAATAAQLLAKLSFIPYSPAEAVNLALLAHPRCTFVFFFAEYATASSSCYDVVIRPANGAFFIHRSAQVTTLQSYHAKHVLQNVRAQVFRAASTASVASASGTRGVAAPAERSSSAVVASAEQSAHPFAACSSALDFGKESLPTSVSTGTSMELALVEETRDRLKDLYDELWGPVCVGMTRAGLSLTACEALFVVADSTLMHVPFSALLPINDGMMLPERGSATPLGAQVTLTVTPSLTHLVMHSVSRCEDYPRIYDGTGMAHPSSGMGQRPPSAGRQIVFLDVQDGEHAASTDAAVTGCDSRSPTHAEGAASATKEGGQAALPPQQHVHTTHPLYTLSPAWSVGIGCTRKELSSALADPHTTAAAILCTPAEDMTVVADGLASFQDIVLQLQQAASNSSQSILNTTAPRGSLQHLELLVLAVDRSVAPSAAEPGITAKLCAQLHCPRILRVDVLTAHSAAGTSHKDSTSVKDSNCIVPVKPHIGVTMQHQLFFAMFMAHLQRAKRWRLRFPYALALRLSVKEAVQQGMPANIWGAFTLVGAP